MRGDRREVKERCGVKRGGGGGEEGREPLQQTWLGVCVPLVLVHASV